MFFMIGSRIIEIKPKQIILSILLILIASVTPFLIGAISDNLKLVFIGIASLLLITLIVIIVIRSEIIQKIKYKFSFQEQLFESYLSLQENRKKILFGFLIIIGLFSAGYGLVQVNYGSLVNGINIDFQVKAKEPSIEQPRPVKITDTTTTTVFTTTTKKKKVTTTTTSTTTTTIKKKKGGGFFSFVKKKPAEEGPKDCTFFGKGHDAILMPSGNYYCRSTEKRIPIYVEGIEKICCVTP